MSPCLLADKSSVLLIDVAMYRNLALMSRTAYGCTEGKVSSIKKRYYLVGICDLMSNNRLKTRKGLLTRGTVGVTRYAMYI